MDIRVKEILKEKGISVAELADRLKISRQALSKQLQGKMLVETADRIAVALDVPLWQFFGMPKEQNAANTVTCPHCGKQIPINIEVKK